MLSHSLENSPPDLRASLEAQTQQFTLGESHVKKAIAVLCFALLGAGASVPASAGTLYTNGPSNYQTAAYPINFGNEISDSFTIAANSTATSATFAVWVFSGDTVSSVDWSIGGSAFGGAVTTATTAGMLIGTNGDACAVLDETCDVYTETISLGSLDLAAGTYWFTLQNAVAPDPANPAFSDPVFWDQSNGPSTADEAGVGNLNGADGPGTNSETFSINGPSVVPEPSSLLLMGSGLLSFAGMMRRRPKA
jgi:hypothetical protein